MQVMYSGRAPDFLKWRQVTRHQRTLGFGASQYGWRNNQNNIPPPRVSKPPLEKKVDLEQVPAQMLTSHTTFMNETKVNMQHQATQFNNQAAQLRNFEVHMG